MTHGSDMRPAGCRAAEPLLSSYAAGALDEDAERQVRDHLAGCATCRTAQAERDPAVLFLELRRHPLPDDFWTGFSARLRRRLLAEERPKAPWFDWAAALGGRRLAYVAAPLVTILLLGTLFLVRPGGPGFRGFHGRGRGTASSPFVVAPGSAQPGRPGAQAPGLRPGLPETSSLAAQGSPPLLEEVGSPSARVYTFTVGEGGSETPIYLVVDESIDI